MKRERLSTLSLSSHPPTPAMQPDRLVQNKHCPQYVPHPCIKPYPEIMSMYSICVSFLACQQREH